VKVYTIVLYLSFVTLQGSVVHTYYMNWVVLTHIVQYLLNLLNLHTKFDRNLLTVFKVILKKHSAYILYDQMELA